MNQEEIAISLHEVGAFKTGKFILKSKAISNTYIDMREIPSSPKVFKKISKCLSELVPKTVDIICGVPMAAMSYATFMSIELEIPLIMCRKEAKDHGTKKLVEGVFKKDQNCLIVEDVLTSGASIIEVLKVLREETGLKITDAIVILDREQGGKENLEKYGIKVHSLLTLSKLVEYLIKNQKIEYMKPEIIFPQKQKILSYGERSKGAKNEISRKLFEIMETKKTNLCLSADVFSKKELLDLAEKCGTEICMIKTHMDVIRDFDQELIDRLVQLSEKHNFLILEDRKFADIGEIVQKQFSEGIFKISSWAHCVTSHLVSGPNILDGLKLGSNGKSFGVLIIEKMSTTGSLSGDDFTKLVVSASEKYSDTVMGFICQKKVENTSEGLLHCTPGVNLEEKGDNLGQNYNTPDSVIVDKQSDVIIVGRGIYKNKNPLEMAKLYREKGWNAYQKRLN